MRYLRQLTYKRKDLLSFWREVFQSMIQWPHSSRCLLDVHGINMHTVEKPFISWAKQWQEEDEARVPQVPLGGTYQWPKTSPPPSSTAMRTKPLTCGPVGGTHPTPSSLPTETFPYIPRYYRFTGTRGCENVLSNTLHNSCNQENTHLPPNH
jgi:hypothetical protein